MVDVIRRSSIRAEMKFQFFRSSDPAAGGWNLGTRLELLRQVFSKYRCQLRSRQTFTKSASIRYTAGIY